MQVKIEDVRMKRQRSKKWRGQALVLAVISAVVLIAMVGCSDDEIMGGEQDPGVMNNDDGVGSTAIYDAEQALMAHQVDEARDIYASVVEAQASQGEAQAGLGITEILLMPGRPTVNEMLFDHFGARQDLDANAVLYDEGGYLYWASRGVRWDDDPTSSDVRGIKSLIAERLPWEEDRLESLAAFSEGLDSSTNDWVRQAVTLANGLGDMDAALEAAIDESSFGRFYVPGEVFHHTDLSLRLGRAELEMVRAALQLFRGAIYFMAAYDHQWTLEDAFGPWREDVEIDDGRWSAGFEPMDYSLDFLGQELFGTVDNEERLTASRRAFRDGLGHLRDALRLGLEQSYTTTLAWGELEPEDAEEIDEWLQAVEQALDGPVELPYTAPQTTLDLSPLFEEGRTLPEGKSWWEPAMDLSLDELDAEVGERWQWSDEALDIALEGVVKKESDEALSVEVGGGFEELKERLLGEWWSSFEEIYFATR